MLKSIRNAFAVLAGGRAKELDNAAPGPARPMTGLLHQLDEKKKQRVIAYKGAEYIGGTKGKPRR
jgi:hypothetical protein